MPSARPAAGGGIDAATRRWSIHAQVMEWLDAQGRSIAAFEAVYLR